MTFMVRLDEMSEEERQTFKQAVDLRLAEHRLLAGTVVSDTAQIEKQLGDKWRSTIDAEISIAAQGLWRG